VAEVFVGLRQEVEAGTPLFRLDSSEQQAAAESARRRIIEVDAALDVARTELQVADCRIAEAQGAYDQALDEYTTEPSFSRATPTRYPSATSRRPRPSSTPARARSTSPSPRRGSSARSGR
jgi:multidrug resistance efflux pump